MSGSAVSAKSLIKEPLKSPRAQSPSYGSTLSEKGIKTRPANASSTAFNIFKSTVGSSILCLPWATSAFGLGLSLFLLFICFILSFKTWMYLIEISDHFRIYEYRKLAQALYGHKFALFVDFNFIIMASIYSILYTVLLSEFIGNGLSEFGISINQKNGFVFSFCSRFFILSVSVLFICGPLTLLNKLSYLKYSSIIGIAATFIAVFYVNYTFLNSQNSINPSVKLVNYENAKTLFYWLEAFGVLSSAFFGHFNASSLYGELQNGTVHKMKNITFWTFCVIAIFLLLMSVTAYLQFGSSVHQNVIESLHVTTESMPIVATLRLLMALSIMSSYPLLFWNLKISFNHLIFSYWKVSEKVKRMIFYGVNVVVWLIALYASGVGVLLSLVQAVSGNFILFVFPAIFYYKFLKIKQKNEVVWIAIDNTQMFELFGIVCFGLLAIVGGVLSIIMNMTGYIHPTD